MKIKKSRFKKWNTVSVIEYLTNKWGDKLIIPDNYNYVDYNYKNKLICPLHGEFFNSLYHLLQNKNACKLCADAKTGISNMLPWMTHKIGFNHRHGNIYDYSLIDELDRKHIKILATDKVPIICKSHGIFNMKVHEHKKGAGCPMCYNESSEYSINNFLYDSISKHGNRYDYRYVFEDYINTKSNIRIICKNHGEFKQCVKSHATGSNCPKCNISRGEFTLESYFKENNINYITQFRINANKNILDKKYFLYDFLLVDYDCLIEYDGKQHFKKIKDMTDNDLKFQIENDKLKDQHAELNNYKIHRIKYNQNIIERINQIMSYIRLSN